MKRILLGALIVLVTAANCFAWDPSGTWYIEGRGDTKMDISCKGDSCGIEFASNYGKYKANCFVNGGKMVCAYNYLTETAFGFILFEQQGEIAMLQKTFDLKGKVAWSGRILRK